eukprot:m.423720 g.423720  ORF g.423720 m.423720 type:complete len:377 (-) comp56662_c0_seq3:366-1496(-)
MHRQTAGMLAVVGACVVLVLLVLLFLKRKSSSQAAAKESSDVPSAPAPARPAQSSAPTAAAHGSLKKDIAKLGKGKTAKLELAKNPLFVAALSHHIDHICAVKFTPNGKYLASSSADRTIRFWKLSTILPSYFDSPVPSGTSVQAVASKTSIEFDHATHLALTVDSRALIVALESNKMRAYKLDKTEATEVCTFPESRLSEGIITIGVAGNENFRYIMSCHTSTVKLWSFKGALLHSFNPSLVENYHAAVTPCGRFVAVSGFAPDVEFYEVHSTRGDYHSIARAFVLGGHQSGVEHFAFTPDSKTAVTVCKDGKWRLFNIECHPSPLSIFLFLSFLLSHVPSFIRHSASTTSASRVLMCSHLPSIPAALHIQPGCV